MRNYSGNWAAYGASIANATARATAASRENAFDAGRMIQRQQDVKSAERISGINAEVNARRRGLKQIAQASANKEGIDNFKEKVANKREERMAGGIAAIGKMAGAGYLASRDNTKNRKLPSTMDARRSLINDYNSNLTDINNRRDTAIDGIKPPELPTSETPGKATSSTDTSAVSTATTGTTGATSTGMTDGWARWSNVIKAGEGTLGDKGYTTMFTGAQFSDFSKHPELLQRSGRLASDAAGAYQFLSTTYNPAAKALGITDFTPESQEKVGKYLAQKRGLAVDTVFTDKASFLKELDKIAPEWASMPTLSTGTSYYGQGGLTPDQAWDRYQSYGQ